MRSLAALLFALSIGLLTALGPVPAHAGPFEDALAKFSTDSFPDTEAAIVELATSGHADAATVVTAAAEGRLLFHPDAKAVYVKGKDDKLYEAATKRRWIQSLRA